MTYYTPDDLAARFGLTREWVMARVRGGELPHLRLGRYVRFTDAHVAAFEAAHDRAGAERHDRHGRKPRRGSKAS